MRDTREFDSDGSTTPSQLIDVSATIVGSPFSGERRRTPRVVTGPAAHVELSFAVDVGVLDLSAGGVLLSCDCRFGIGHRTLLHLLLGGEPFVAWIEVRREEEVPAPGGARSGSIPGGRRLYLDRRDEQPHAAAVPPRPPRETGAPPRLVILERRTRAVPP